MSHPVVFLGEVTSTIMGQAPPGKECNKKGVGTIFVKAGEFSDRYPVVREWTTRPLKFAAMGDVLVCVVGATAGKINLGIDCAIGRSVAAVRPKSGLLDTNYLYHFLVTETMCLRNKSQGLAQGVITREMLAQLSLPLPPVVDQKRIAAILDQANDLRLKRLWTLKRLSDLKQAVFRQMFASDGISIVKAKLGDLIKVRSVTLSLLKTMTQRGDFRFTEEMGSMVITVNILLMKTRLQSAEWVCTAVRFTLQDPARGSRIMR
jgi:type I restriction enzyme S subunit